jgi:hypothetical protein
MGLCLGVRSAGFLDVIREEVELHDGGNGR